MQGWPMLGSLSGGTPVDFVAHIIQVALTPVFLLSGIATLLNVFSTRFARVADQIDKLKEDSRGANGPELDRIASQLVALQRRSLALDTAVILAAFGGAATCAAVLTLFVGSLSNTTVASVLLLLFGGAVVCALGSIAAFTVEMLMAGIGMRARAASESLPDDGPTA